MFLYPICVTLSTPLFTSSIPIILPNSSYLLACWSFCAFPPAFKIPTALSQMTQYLKATSGIQLVPRNETLQ